MPSVKSSRTFKRNHLNVIIPASAVIAFIVFAILLIGVFFLGKSPEKLTITTPIKIISNFDMPLMQKVWGDSIKKNPQKAYTLFEKTLTNLHNPFGYEHNAAHLFGRLLYKTGDVKNVGVCNDAFKYGCFHGFVQEAITTKGLSVVKEMSKICNESPNNTPCGHGMGHALMDYFATSDHILKAIQICEDEDPHAQLEQRSPDVISGCQGGVIMASYNLYQQYPPKDVPVNNNPYSPCSELPTKYQRICYYNQPILWLIKYDNDYKKIGKLCQGPSDPKYRQLCYSGFGTYVVSMLDLTEKEGVDACKQMPSHEGELYCRVGVYNVVLALMHGSKLVGASCRVGLTSSESTWCLESVRTSKSVQFALHQKD